METDITTTNQPYPPKPKTRVLPSHPFLIAIFAGIPTFYFINKFILGYYFGCVSQEYEDIAPKLGIFQTFCYGRDSLLYSDYEPQTNLILILVETILISFIFLLFKLLFLFKRRRYQYSLRTLMIFVTLCVISCSWFAVKMQQAKKQREMIETIEKEGHLLADYDESSSPFLRLFAYLFGKDFCYGINNIYVDDTATDADLKSLTEISCFIKLSSCRNVSITDDRLLNLQGLSNLKSLELIQNNNITDAGLVHLKSLGQLEELNLSWTKITDDGLKELNDMQNLRTLILCGTSVTGKGFVNCKGLSHLKHLDLSVTKGTDSGLGGLESLRNIQKLELSNTDISDAGLVHVTKMTNLYYLDLINTKITDNGLRQLKDLQNLRRLILTGTNISDVGLIHLKGLKQLDKLVIDKTHVTDEGIRDLRKALPKLNIYREYNITSYHDE